MRALIDTIFGPVLNWLITIQNYISELSVPLSRPINLSNYLGYFNLLGSSWIAFVQTVISLCFIYGVAYVIVNFQGLYLRFKDSVKWW